MKFYKYILFVVVLIIITDTFRYLSWIEYLNIEYSTYIIVFLNYLSLIFIIYIAYKTSRYIEFDNRSRVLMKFWIFLNLFNILRGAILANNYWDWKFLFLSSITFSFVSFVFYIGGNFLIVRKIFRLFLRYIFIFGFLIIPLSITNQELYSRLMIPISFFIIFIPYFKPKSRLLIIIVAIFSIILVLGFRTNIIKITISLFILFVYYFRKIISLRIIRLVHLSFFIIPLIFIFLSLFGTYNIFQEIAKNEDYLVIENNDISEDLLADSRSFLYYEVASSMNGVTEWIFGKSLSKGYNSVWFYDTGGALNGIRYSTEVNILNIFLYHGLIGVSLYFLLLFTVSYHAILNSNNFISKMIGLLIASRWFLSFIEEFSQFDLNFFFFWLIIGLVSSKYFKKMSDNEVKELLYKL